MGSVGGNFCVICLSKALFTNLQRMMYSQSKRTGNMNPHRRKKNTLPLPLQLPPKLHLDNVCTRTNQVSWKSIWLALALHE